MKASGEACLVKVFSEVHTRWRSLDKPTGWRCLKIPLVKVFKWASFCSKQGWTPLVIKIAAEHVVFILDLAATSWHFQSQCCSHNFLQLASAFSPSILFISAFTDQLFWAKSQANLCTSKLKVPLWRQISYNVIQEHCAERCGSIVPYGFWSAWEMSRHLWIFSY